MDVETAKNIFLVIIVAGCAVWAHSLRKALQLGRNHPPAEPTQFDVSEGAPEPATESGAFTLRGQPAELSQALIKSMVQYGFGMIPTLYTIERTDHLVSLTKNGPILCNQPRTLSFSDADISFEPLGDDTTQVAYWLGFEKTLHRIRRITLAIIFGVGLPLLIGVGAAVWFLVIPDPQPAVRFRVFQTLHIVHGLWPPYLVMSFYSTRQAKALMESLIVSIET